MFSHIPLFGKLGEMQGGGVSLSRRTLGQPPPKRGTPGSPTTIFSQWPYKKSTFFYKNTQTNQNPKANVYLFHVFIVHVCDLLLFLINFNFNFLRISDVVCYVRDLDIPYDVS
jgi:hypothetical protein